MALSIDCSLEVDGADAAGDGVAVRAATGAAVHSAVAVAAADAHAHAPTPTPTDALRAATLQRLALRDAGPSPVLDAVVAAAAAGCGTPIALVSLLDADRQWFQANVGLDGVDETPRAVAFCDHAIRGAALFEVPDARRDPRFAANPLVTGDPGIRFYAGMPIESAGVRVGTVCVIDRQPRQLQPAERLLLQALGRVAAAALVEQARSVASTRALAASERRYRAIVEEQGELISLAARDGTLTFVNGAYARHFGLAPAALVGRSLFDFVPADDRPLVAAHWDRAWATGGAHAQVNRVGAAGDEPARWVAWTNRVLLDARGQIDCMQSVGRDITEQKLAEEALAASEQRHRSLYETTPAMLHSIDARGRLLAVSDRWLDTLGYARDEVLGRTALSFLTPASARQARDSVLPAFFASGGCDHVPCQFVRKDGSLVDVLLSAVLERDAAGAPLRALTVLQDVREQRRVEAELGRTHARLDAIVDNLPALLGHWDAQGITRFVNREFQSAFGLPLERILGHSVESVCSATDPVAWQTLKPAIAAVAAGRRQDFELPLLTTAGLRQLRVTLVPDGGGFYGMAHDITGRKALELRLSDSEQRYRSLFDHLNSGFALHEVVVGADGRPTDHRFLAVNDAFCRLLGQSADRLVGRRVTEVIPEIGSRMLAGIDDQPVNWIERLGRVAVDGVPLHFEHHATRFDRWHAVVAFRPAPGQFATIVQDVSRRKQAEFALQAALQDKEALLKEVHHRVKNNLQMVQGLLDLQCCRLTDSVARAALDDTARRVHAMALVHEKLYRSKNLAAVALADYARDLLRQIGDGAGAAARAIRIEADIAALETPIDAAVAFGLLLAELVANALRHGFPGGSAGGTVRVQLERRAAGAWLAVADDGAGLADGFDLAACPSLGLQLAQRLARQLGGTLAADGGGRGTVFSALLQRL